MANYFYHNYANLMFGDSGASGALADLENDTIKVYLLDAGQHTTSLSADVFEDDLTGAAIISEATLTGKTIAAGEFSASDSVFETVPQGNTGEEIVLWHDTTNSATSPLIANINTAGSSTLPVTSNGGNIVVAWGSNILDLVN